MPYCITLRSRTDAKTLGWYDGSNYRWSTDYTRQVLFKEKPDAKLVCDELRSLFPRNAKVINVEREQVGLSLDPEAALMRSLRYVGRLGSDPRTLQGVGQADTLA